MNLVNVLTERSELKLRGVFFISNNNQEDFLSYHSLYHSALKVLSCLQDKGMPPNSELVFQIEDNKSFLIIFWACLLGGIIPVPLATSKNEDHNRKFSQVWSLLSTPSLIISPDALNQLEYYLQSKGQNDLLQQIRSNLLFVDDVFSSNKDGNICQPGDNDIAFIQFSSGSTGSPKGVMLTHANLIANVNGIANAASYSENDSMLSWMPLTHDMGMIGFHINPLFCGLNHYIIPTSAFVRNPKLWLDKVSELKITITSSPNFGYRYLLKHLDKYPSDWDLSCVRIIYNGAEPISERLCHEFNERLAEFGLTDVAMCPVYGLAEASVAVTMSSIDNKIKSISLNRQKLNSGEQIEVTDFLSTSGTFVNVGKPVDGCSIQIADERNQILAENIVGRIKIKGTNVTGGYYNNKNAYDEITDERGWLDTGDLGFVNGGDLYITGRAKDIIFINGQNYYAHDIEKEAETVQGIELNKIAICSSFAPESQSEEVIAFLLHRGALKNLVSIARALKMVINEKFGIGLSAIVPVKNIPRTTSGKLQRFKLRQLYDDGAFRDIEQEFTALLNSFDDDTVVPPANDLEEKILNLWEDILQSKNIGVEKNFIQVGGNSLKGAELIMKLHHSFQVDLPIEKLYEFQTVRKLASEIANLQHKAYHFIPKAPLYDLYPVSASQRRIYYAWKIAPNSIAYNMPIAVKLRGGIDLEKLQESLAKLVARHDALRMTFSVDEEPRFRVKDDEEVSLGLIKCEKGDWDEKLKQLILPFDLAKGPLFKFVLLYDNRGYNGDSLLLLDFHHIISDGQSAYLFIDELLKVYGGTRLPDADTSFRDFVIWERASKETRESTRLYWADHLSGEIPALEISRDFPRSAIPSMMGKRQMFTLDKLSCAKLKEISANNQVTSHTLFFTLYLILLAKYSGQEDFIVGIPAHGRIHPSLQKVHGMFANNLPIRSLVKGGRTFSDLLTDSARLINKALDRQDMAFDDLVNFIKALPRPGRSPLFDTMFLYQNLAIDVPEATGTAFSRYLFDPGFSKFDISLEISEENDQINYAFEYCTQLFKDETIWRFLQGLKTIINQVIANPEILIKDILILDTKEFENFNIDYNKTSRKTEAFATVQEIFEKRVKSYPEDIAIEYDGKEISYQALNIKANQVACALSNKAIGNGDIVGVHLKRSTELVATILGILKAGAAYLPLELEMPAERIKFVVRDSGCKFLISDSSPELGDVVFPEVLTLEYLFGSFQNKYLQIKNGETDLAYVIYTSGTTGQPKGVMIEHGSLSNYIVWAGNRYIENEPCSFAFYSSISFDLTVTSIFVPLITGNKMIIYSENDTLLSIENVIRENKADIIKLTPSHLRILKGNHLMSPKSKVKKLILGGEVLDTNLAKGVYEEMGRKVQIFNEYGPTEATVGCMIYQFDPEDTNSTVPIGRPIDNTQIYLLDSYLKPVPVNVPGEIYIAGRALARGYLFLEKLTSEKFIENPYIKGDRMYKTGDIGRRMTNGSLEFMGRNDKQVKINGNRVEISEIENQLLASGQIKEVVIWVDDKDRDHMYTCYTPIVSGSQLQETFFMNYLAERLPYYMIPREFIQVDFMPLTVNGKIDIAKLQGFKRTNSNAEKVLAKNETERIFAKIWGEVLNVEKVGVTDNFFEAGGDSIKAVQISSRLFDEGVSVKVKDILTYHTIAYISQRAEHVNGRRIYKQEPEEGEFSPTPIQAWFFSHRLKNPHFFNQSILFSINCPLNLVVLEQAFNALIEHHDAFRINYNPETNSFFYNNKFLKETQVIRKLDISDDCTLSDICNDVRNSFNILNSLLVRMVIIRHPDGREYLFITAHHLVMDGLSWRIFLEDFFKAYSLATEGTPVSLPQKTASFKEWSLTLNQLAESEEMQSERLYWEKMADPSFTLPTDFVSENSLMRHLRKEVISLDKKTTAFLLKGAHKSYNTDVPILLNAALIQTLHQWTGLGVFIIEQENYGRYMVGLDASRTIGWFTSMYPVKLTYSGEVNTLLKSVKEIMKGVPNMGIGYGINTFLPFKTTQASKISEIRLNYLGQFGSELNNRLVSLIHDANGTETDPENVFTAKLELNAIVIDGVFQMEIAYDSTLFKGSTISRLGESFLSNLTGILTYLKNEDDLYFTPSDFSAADLNEEDIKILFGEN
ncbi:non-ribosomal peptide synthetase [Mucilaginibacter sp. SJ]|uniref:non-ribosomal peptide synthetase n=1 Tax=Mucilaginibacter sp. SJ TaxID=3029053 RepID=UPI0023A9398A|nr:non-ribosomal peptide synthetase [Mucilaginibacter sp. SJ]WEA01632.1 amino acid adenylation domain-containing protein [Mucilaginibacter sp. SJ]